MAKKKGGTPKPPATLLSSKESFSSLLELAQPVSDRVQIEALIVSECGYKRLPAADFNKPFQIDGMVNHKVVMIARTPGDERFAVGINFTFNGRQEGVEEPTAFISCTFIIFYSCKELDSLTEENLRGFSETNAVYNAWPYWREFVQDASLRMGLGPIVMPVFRLM